MQKSVLRILTESGEANISCDDDEKCVDSGELLGIDICDFNDSSLVEMLWLMHIISLEYGSRLLCSTTFDGISVQRSLHRGS